MDTNSVTICGELVVDPDIRYHSSGDIVASMIITTQCPCKGTTQHHVVLKDEWGELARDKFQAGMIVYVSGFLTQTYWEYEPEPRLVVMAAFGLGICYIIDVVEEVYNFEPC